MDEGNRRGKAVIDRINASKEFREGHDAGWDGAVEMYDMAELRQNIATAVYAALHVGRHGSSHDGEGPRLAQKAIARAGDLIAELDKDPTPEG